MNEIICHPRAEGNGDSACPFCGGRLSVQTVRETMSYVTPKGAVELTVDVPYDTCDECGYQAFGEAGERARTAAIYRYHGRLTPWEIVAIRERLELTQKSFSDLLGVGHASLERWETGETMQNQSMDNLLMLLSNPQHKIWLDAERRRRAKEDVKTGVIVSLGRFRALQDAETADLIERSSRFQLRRSQF